MISPHLRLSKMIERDRIPHLLLFMGERSAELGKSAYDFASELLSRDDLEKRHQKKLQMHCHSDIHEYFPTGKLGMHSIDSLKAWGEQIAMRPLLGRKKVFILHEADRCLPTSSNALLKVLEEPTEGTIIILTATKKQSMLPTIVSRAQVIVFPGEQKEGANHSRFLDLFTKGGSWQALEQIASEIDGERQAWEKEKQVDLPSDLSALQKERYEKEIEGAVTLKYQERVFDLLESLLTWSKNETFNALIEQKPPAMPSFSYIEKQVAKSRLAIERGVSLQSVLEYLFFRLS